MIKPKQGGSAVYVPTKPIYLNRHVSNLVLLIPVEERETSDNDVSNDEIQKNVAEENVTNWTIEEYILFCYCEVLGVLKIWQLKDVSNIGLFLL